MAAGSAKEVREGMTGVKRAAEWDPAQRYGKNARQVFCWVLRCVSCSVCFSFSLWIFIQATACEDLGVISNSAGKLSEYFPAVFIHAPPEACPAFNILLRK